jgi:hypothetical protein
MTLTWEFGVDWDKDGVYTDESARLTNLYVSRGRSRMYTENGSQAFNTGVVTATLDNYDKRYDPYNTGGALYSYLLPGRPFRLKVTESAVTHWVFGGWLLDPRPQGGIGSTAVFNCTDGFHYLGMQKPTAIGPETDYVVSNAVNDLLNQATWPFNNTTDTFSWTFTLTLGPAEIDNNGDTIDTFEIVAGTSTILDELRELAEAYGGSVFVNKSGGLVYRARDTVRTTAATYTDSLVSSYIEQSMPWDQIFNEISVTKFGGSTPQTASDTTSQGEYGVSYFDLTTNSYIQTDAHALDYAGWLGMYLPELKRNLRFRVEDRFAYQFGVDLMDRVQVTIAALEIDDLYQIEQIEHNWDAGRGCVTTLRLSRDFIDVAGIQTYPFTFTLNLGW